MHNDQNPNAERMILRIARMVSFGLPFQDIRDRVKDDPAFTEEGFFLWHTAAEIYLNLR